MTAVEVMAARGRPGGHLTSCWSSPVKVQMPSMAPAKALLGWAPYTLA